MLVERGWVKYIRQAFSMKKWPNKAAWGRCGFIRTFRMGMWLAVMMGAWAGMPEARAQGDVSAVSFRVVESASGGVDVEWTRDGSSPWLLGWHVEAQRPDGEVVRLTKERVEAELFDSPSRVYRFHDADSSAWAGKRVSYRVVRVDPENREWASGFSSVEVEAKEKMAKAVVPESSPAKEVSRKADVGTRVRMSITNDGLYRVTAAQLAAVLQGSSTALVSQAIAQTNFVLTCGGSNVAWRAEEGGAAILFFGQAYRDVYTDRNVYWLDPGPGLGMISTDGTTASVAENPWFWETARMERNLNFSDYLPGGAEDDYFVWTGRQLTTPSTNWLWTTNVPVADIHPNVRTGTVTAYLVSAWDGAVELDNHTRLAAAGQWLDDRRWAGDERMVQSGAATNLTGTSIPVTVEMRRDADVTTTTVLIDALEVRYARRMKALNNQLLFRPESGTNTLTVRGFSTSAIRVWDVSSPLRPVEMATTVVQEGSEWRTSWSVSPASTGRYLAASAYLQPERIDGVSDGGWALPQAGAPHLVIASRALTNAAAALVEHRCGQGLSSRLVPFEELCDSFAHGRRDPRVIPRFLAYAQTHWTVPPVFVCLAGDGHLDYTDSFGQAVRRPNHVPPIQDRIPYSTTSGSTLKTIGLDNPLADTDGDGFPDLSIGRLPAQTSASLVQMINRIIAHESSDDWKSKVLMVSDKDVNDAFGQASARLAAHVSPGMSVQRLAHTASTSETAMRTNFIVAMNAAPSISVYLGHANNVGISSPYFFEHSYLRSYMSTLTNAARNPLLLAGTCMLNDFAQPHTNNRCLGKGFLDTAPGGAVAVWAAAAEATLPMAESTTASIFDNLFSTQQQRLGNLIQPALELQADSASPWIARSSVLMGDPGTRIRTYLFTEAWDEGYQSLGGGWRRLDWFGDYVPMGSEGWIWHNQHGYFYVADLSTPDSVWMYAMDMGWLWTGASLYPYLYRSSDGAWIWYNGATSPRWFYNLTAGYWESRP